MEKLWSFAMLNMLTFFWLFVPPALILVVSIANSMSLQEPRKLLPFYCAMVAIIFFGGFEGIITGSLSEEPIVVVSGMFVMALLGVILGWLSGKHSVDGENFYGIFGGIAGALIGMLSGAFAVIQDFQIILQYCLFILAAEVISFATAWIVESITKRLREEAGR